MSADLSHWTGIGDLEELESRTSFSESYEGSDAFVDRVRSRIRENVTEGYYALAVQQGLDYTEDETVLEHLVSESHPLVGEALGLENELSGKRGQEVEIGMQYGINMGEAFKQDWRHMEGTTKDHKDAVENVKIRCDPETETGDAAAGLLHAPTRSFAYYLDAALEGEAGYGISAGFLAAAYRD